MMIINRGKKVIVGRPNDLRNRINGILKVEITLKNLTPEIVTAVKNIPHVKQVHQDESTSKLSVNVDDIESDTPELVKKVVEMDHD